MNCHRLLSGLPPIGRSTRLLYRGDSHKKSNKKKKNEKYEIRFLSRFGTTERGRRQEKNSNDGLYRKNGRVGGEALRMTADECKRLEISFGNPTTPINTKNTYNQN